jgi:hypothetical protein
MKSKRNETLLISGLILFSVILFITGQGDLQYKIGFIGNIILSFISISVWGFTLFYIAKKIFFKNKNEISVVFFKISFLTSLALFIMTLPIINYCDGWQTRQNMGSGYSQYLNLIGIISFIYLLFLVILFLVNFIVTIANYFKKKGTFLNVVFSVIIPLSGLIALIIFNLIMSAFGLNENGKCDFIMGPSDTSLSFILFITIIMNLIQYRNIIR